MFNPLIAIKRFIFTIILSLLFGNIWIICQCRLPLPECIVQRQLHLFNCIRRECVAQVIGAQRDGGKEQPELVQPLSVSYNTVGSKETSWAAFIQF